MNPGQQQQPVPSISVSKWDQLRTGSQKTSKAERSSKTRSMVLTNFSGCVEDVALDGRGGPASGAAAVHPSTAALSVAAKTASLPRHSMSPQWPTLQGGSIVSDYLTHLDTVSLFFFLSVVVAVVVVVASVLVPRSASASFSSFFQPPI